MSEPKRIGGGSDLLATLAEAAGKYGDGKTYPTDEHGRLRICSRCESHRAQFIAHNPDWVPNKCHSWLRGNRRYWAGVCFPCGEIEIAERKAAQSGQTQAVATGPKPTLGMRWQASQGQHTRDWRDPE